MSLLDGWSYRKPVTLSHASGVVTNYQMKILIGESSGATGEEVDCGGLCLSNFNDLRFTAADGTTLLDYWIENISGSTPNQLATVWVEFDSIGTGATTFYMYYGKADAAAYSDGANTFPFFDDFPGTSLDTANKWDIASNPTIVVAGGTVKITANSTSWGSIYTKSTRDAPYALEVRFKGYNTSGWAIPLSGTGTPNYQGNVVGYYGGQWSYGFDNGGVGSWSGDAEIYPDEWYRVSHKIIDTTHAISFWTRESDGTTKTGLKTFTTPLTAEAAGMGQHNSGAWEEADFFAVRKCDPTEPAWGSWGAEELSSTPVPLGYATLAIKAWGLTMEEIASIGLGVANLIFNALGISQSRFHAIMGDPRISGAAKPKARASAVSPQFTLAPGKKPRAKISMEGD